MSNVIEQNTTKKEKSGNNLNSENRAAIAPASNNSTEDFEQISVVAHYRRLDSKLILQNMEEVLDTVKKQHKEKHRRKKELKKLAMIEAANGSEIIPPTDGEPNSKKEEKSEKKHKRKYKEKRLSKKDPLQDESTEVNVKVLHVNSSKSGTILHHFHRSPKKEENELAEDESGNVRNELTHSKNSLVTNAFEVMMNARNKSIGSNTPGTDFPTLAADKELAAANAKRKLKLQEWAEQKGGGKRKLEEEARSAYVDDQLEQRAKRFKQMLVSGAIQKTSSLNDSKTKIKAKNDGKTTEKPQKKQKNRRESKARRLSSVDSIDSLEPLTPPKVDDEISEFLAKLNSPTKKRDSLLGYFYKKGSPNEISVKQTSGETRKDDKSTMKKSVKIGLSNHCTPSVSSHNLQENVECKVVVHGGRPKRSCVGKARYDYDLDVSPSKNTKLGKTTTMRKTTMRKINTADPDVRQEPDCDDIIILDDSTNMNDTTTSQGTPKKLAPLFVRTLLKPSPDPEIVKARKAFLQSGVPDKLRIELEKQKQYELNFEEAAEMFPKISHIKQLTKNELVYDTGKLKSSLKLNSEDSIIFSPSSTRKSKSKSNKRQSIVGWLSDCITHDVQVNIQRNKKSQSDTFDQISLPSLANKRAIIKNWKTEFERFPTFKCYNQMREKYRYFSAIDSAQDTEQVSESFVVTRQTRRLEAQDGKESEDPDEEYKPPSTAPNGELLFSEKYKPLLFEQVLVNLNPVTQLKEFLSNWSNSGTVSARNSQALDDSMDLNDSTCSNQGPVINTVVLLGPVSSGKTNAVFALANEMNFNVLEINAGMKRTGKRLIQELQEATQSHQIRNDGAGSGSGSSQKSLLKMSLNGLKSKLKKQDSKSNQVDSQNADSCSSDLQYSARKCLILIEDADIVFEQTDAGFTDAIYSLAASSKRPVIIVASNPNCGHLQRLMSQNTIHFSPPNVLSISKFLAVLSLMENCPVQLDDLISLYLYNRCDLRKTLLELQFFIQSGGDRQRQPLDRDCLKGNDKENSNHFASPRKRQFSVEQQESEGSDNTTSIDKDNASSKSTDQVYMHRSLFEYYTMCQNSKTRIPFPIDFHLLHVNLNEIFQVSQKLKEGMKQKSCEKITQFTTRKRRSKSPKKQLSTTMRANSNSPLDNLCSFYENLSIAALMDAQDNVLRYEGKQKPSIIDRLKPNISENISHFLLEKTIEVNLDAESCPYNLFDNPKNSVSLCGEFGSIQLRSNRARYLDYEPSLRSICRSEKIRSSLERRSTRFYHYLRNYSINVCNFSTAHLDHACEAFQLSEPEQNQAEKRQH